MRSVHYQLLSLRALALASLTILGTCSTLNGQILTYQLQPGATITRSPAGGVIFPSEPLTGTFQWLFVGTQLDGAPAFDLMGLSFSSPSFSVQLDPASASENIFDPPPSTLGTLGGFVILTGLSPSHAYFQTIGNYAGPAPAPTSLNFVDNHSLVLNVSIVSVDEHNSLVAPIADTSFVAVLVPEPSAFALLSLATLGLINRRRFLLKR